MNLKSRQLTCALFGKILHKGTHFNCRVLNVVLYVVWKGMPKRILIEVFMLGTSDYACYY
jgi:hypothetical protein